MRVTTTAATSPGSSRLRLRVSAAAEKQLRAGHPWVFGDSVREQNRDGTAGELAVIYDRSDKFLAVGFFDPDSPIRLRVLHLGKPTTIDAAFWQSRLDAAVRRRDGLFDARTTGYRVINGESDGWPGLVLDRYDTTLVLKVYTTAWLSRLEEIVSLVQARLQPEQIILRLSRNIQAGAAWKKSPHHEPPPHPAYGHPLPRSERGRGKGEGALLGSGVQCAKLGWGNSHPGPLPFGRGEGELSAGAEQSWRDGEVVFRKRAGAVLGAPVLFLENGLRFEAEVVRGQKTGFFLDQRENRRLVESLAGGRAVLNAFSFSGGFSLYAARGRARSVTDLDLSKHALESARRNFALNQTDDAIAHCGYEQVQADAFAWLAGNPGRKFDLIILDPPSLAKREAERAGAIRAYIRLATDGLKHLAREGILLACSCSAHVTAEEFFGAVRQAVRDSGRKHAELKTTLHAPDHPATFKEAEYLKGIYLSVH